MRRRHYVATLAVALFALPAAAAQAHVTLQPNELPAGGFKKLDVRVPNERDKAATSKVVVQFPEGFTTVSHEAVEGWRVAVENKKLATPIEVEGEKVTERLSTVTFSAERGSEIQPGEYRDFGLSLRMPEQPTTLTFKALQSYNNGEVVRWIGPPDSEEPAPQVKLTAAPPEEGAEPAAAAPAAEADDDEDEDEGSDGLAIAALIVGGLGLLAGIAALMTSRRART
jgi:periplasmic copper chaperone A